MVTDRSNAIAQALWQTTPSMQHAVYGSLPIGNVSALGAALDAAAIEYLWVVDDTQGLKRVFVQGETNLKSLVDAGANFATASSYTAMESFSA